MTGYRPWPGRVLELRGRGAECEVLERLLGTVRAGESRALVVCGEPGAGKTALLDYLAGQASGCRVAAAAGVQSEMELAFAGLHQLCAPMLGRLERLPGPQRDALRTAFGMSAGPVPDRFMVGLAVLGLLSEMAAARPLVCLVDDEQWLDHASAQVLAFAARRLGAEAVGLVFGARVSASDLAGLPELVVAGLREDDARALLCSAPAGPLDEQVRDQFVAETRGNPLALLELPRGLMAAELAGGFGLPGALPLPGRIEESFRRRVEALPDQTRGLLLLAAAEPAGDPALVWRQPRGWGSAPKRRGPRPTRAWPSSAAGCCSVIRWCARLPTGRRRLRRNSRCTAPWPRPPIRRSIPTAAPGTGPTPPPGRRRTSPRSWSARPAGRRHAEGWPRRRRSWSGPRR